MSALFETFRLNELTLRNRIVVSPMCQYSAVNGVMTGWHRAHYDSLARGGAALVILEATAVSPEGRITPGCAGLWTDEQAHALAPIARSIKEAGAVPGIQLAHAGSKASSNRPWEGAGHIPDDDPRGWQTLSASPMTPGGGLRKIPRRMTLEDIGRVQSDFVAAAVRARTAGIEWLELHFAHGYLAMNFFSRHSNQRTDEYGGSLENRGRFLLETIAAVRKVWPAALPLTIRFGAVEFDGHDEENFAESVELLRQLKKLGIDLIDVSVGGSSPASRIPQHEPALLVPTAQRIGTAVGLPVTTSWGLGRPETAENAIATRQLDLVTLAKSMLANPHWPYYAARKLGVDKAAWTLPAQYAYWLEHYAEEQCNESIEK